MAKKKNKISINDIIAGTILGGMLIAAFKKPSSVGARRNKYRYEVVLQSNHGYGWDDEMSAETDSNGVILDPQERAEWRENKRLYKENTRGAIRVISRKTKL